VHDEAAVDAKSIGNKFLFRGGGVKQDDICIALFTKLQRLTRANRTN
jgi:hypothetical protein